MGEPEGYKPLKLYAVEGCGYYGWGCLLIAAASYESALSIASKQEAGSWKIKWDKPDAIEPIEIPLVDEKVLYRYEMGE